MDFCGIAGIGLPAGVGRLTPAPPVGRLLVPGPRSEPVCTQIEHADHGLLSEPVEVFQSVRPARAENPHNVATTWVVRLDEVP